MQYSVQASPTKRFFVSMLTRDIDLKDAVLDLLDNCVDGILRQLPKNVEGERPYEGYWAKIVANPEMFSISDNCGGIPKEIAVSSAFRLGRMETDRDKDIATVGMYGIGMKRAIFKMGRYSRVTSKYKEESYYVEIKPEWMDNDTDWDLDLVETEDMSEVEGTSIIVNRLHDPISFQFDKDKSPFLGNLSKEICSLFALIMKKGFKVYLNDVELEAVPLDILFPRDFNSQSISPYAYVGTLDGVSIELFVGFYRPLASQAEIDEELSTPRTRDNAGWTVICNDRVVLHRDKSPLTGWGDANVPKYHNQFIAIAGVVRFYSNEPLKLPLNTTKRGLETSSSVYWHTLRFMREGLKKFTDFTNHWKGREQETTYRFEASTAKDVTEVIRSIPSKAWQTVPAQIRGEKEDGKRFIPNLPRPPREETRRRITFFKPIDQVEYLGRYFFDDPRADPSEIGHRCFDETLKNAREDQE